MARQPARERVRLQRRRGHTRRPRTRRSRKVTALAGFLIRRAIPTPSGAKGSGGNPAQLVTRIEISVMTGHEIVKAAGAGGLWRVMLAVLASFLADPGPLGEELGWRGFALPRLLEGRNALSAAVVLGIIWGVWHLPAFLIAGTPQSNMSFPILLIGAVALSVLMTWAFNGTRGSVLVAILIHWTFNTCFDSTRMPLALFSAGVLVIAAVVVVAIEGPELSRSHEYEATLAPPARVVARQLWLPGRNRPGQR